jgi:TetR/AcrR family transcriptional regulator, repressor for uid operon
VALKKTKAETAPQKRARMTKIAPPPSKDSSTRESIVRAATLAFATYGYQGASNKMVASMAGIAPGLIYHYFDSKLDMFAAVYSYITEYRYDRSKKVVDGEPTIGGKIYAMAADLVDMWQEDSSYVEFHARTLYEAQHEQPLKDALQGARRGTEKLWVEIVEDAKSKGEIPASVPTNAVTDACISWFTGLVVLLPARGEKRTLAATKIFAEGIAALGKA